MTNHRPVCGWPQLGTSRQERKFTPNMNGLRVEWTLQWAIPSRSPSLLEKESGLSSNSMSAMRTHESSRPTPTLSTSFLGFSKSTVRLSYSDMLSKKRFPSEKVFGTGAAILSLFLPALVSA